MTPGFCPVVMREPVLTGSRHNPATKEVLRMPLRVGDRVEVSYPVDDFPGHVGIVREIKKVPSSPEKQS